MNVQRLSRPAFEAVLWQNGPGLASRGASRLQAADTVMDAFDRSRRGRQRKRPAVDIRAEAEAARQHADLVNQPTDAEIAGRRRLLAAEVAEYDRYREAAGLRAKRRNRKPGEEGMRASA